MGKCMICGKRGLFLKVDALGRCNECAQKEREKEAAEAREKAEKEEQEFESYYSNMLFCLKKLQEDIEVDDNPIEALSIIPLIRDKVNECEVLKAEIHNPQYENKLFDKLIKSITYSDDFSRKYGIGRLEAFDIGVRVNSISKEYSKDEIFSDIDKRINAHARFLNNIIKSIQNSAAFQQKIDAIAEVNVEKSNTNHNKREASELEEIIKCSSITAKTCFERLGDFVVIDTETTGLSPTRDNLVEVAAIRFENWVPIQKFHTLLNPGKHIPDKASAINNITDDMVADAPAFMQIIDSLNAFVGKSNIVGHNLPFDLKFLYRYGYDFTANKRRYYDTCEIAKKTLKKPKLKWDKDFDEYVINYDCDYDVEDYKLTTLCDYYQIRDNMFAHRALSDALATGELFKRLAMDRIGT